MTAVVDARFAGGPILVERLDGPVGFVRVEIPGCRLDLFPHEAIALAAALNAAALSPKE